jgi:hypothetical protein
MKELESPLEKGKWFRRMRLSGRLAFAGATVALGCLAYLAMLILDLTDTEPRDIPLPATNVDETERLENRVRAFLQALRQRAPTAPLVLSAADLNTLVSIHPGLRDWRGHLRIDLNGEQARARTSVRLEKLHISLFSKRYFNGVVAFSISFDHGVLRVFATEIRNDRRRLPQLLMHLVKRKNLAEAINEDPRFSLTLENIQTITVSRGKLAITQLPLTD